MTAIFVRPILRLFYTPILVYYGDDSVVIELA